LPELWERTLSQQEPSFAASRKRHDDLAEIRPTLHLAGSPLAFA
jgi:hypothetical protein